MGCKRRAAAGHSGRADAAKLGRSEMMVWLLLLSSPTAPQQPWPGTWGEGGMMNSEWVHVVERERGNVWGAGHHSATNSQPRIFLRWPGPGSIHLFICCFGDSKIMELSDTFMIFCIRELIVMSNWINYWILNEWSTFKKCWYLKPQTSVISTFSQNTRNWV